MPTTASPSRPEATEAARRDRWFDDVVAQLRVDQLQLQTDTASEAKRAHYDLLVGGDADALLLRQQEQVTQHFVTRLLVSFVVKLRPHLPRIRAVAATSNDAEVLLWIELREEDELLEDQLTMIEAEVNAEFHDRGYDADLMIVEREDALPIPEHYAVLYHADESLPSAPTTGEQ